MNIVDLIIIIFILFGAVLGFKRGFTKSLVSALGFVATVVLAFLLKNPVSVMLYENLPFFKFGGILKGVTVLNIALYEILAFVIVLAILSVALKLLLFATSIFEKVLNATIILGIPSKILGALFGIVQNLIYIFIVLYILSLPIFNLGFIKNSKIANTILDKTPILNKVCDETLDIFNEIIDLREEYKTATDVNKFNQKALNSMIEKRIITKENAKKLISKGKIKGVIIE